jgi:hypothetical protein
VKWTTKKQGARTLFFDGDEHVATVLSKDGAWFTWYTRNGSGTATSFEDAKKAIISKLE